MTLLSRIGDGEGSGNEAGVTGRHALKVTVTEPIIAEIPVEELIARKQYREFFTDSSGSSDLNVDGSVTSQDFTVRADTGRVKWIVAIRFLLEDTYMEIDTNDFRRFGTAAIAPGLTNGIEMFVQQGEIRTDLFPEPVKNIGDFMDTADRMTNLINSVGAQEDWLMFEFWLDWPIALPAGSSDLLCITVNDNLVPVDRFRVLARGYQEAY